MPDSLPSSRVSLIQAIQTPLGFLVLAVMVLEGFLVFLFQDAQADDRRILTYGILLTLMALFAVVVVLAVWQPEALGGTRRSDHTVLIGGGVKSLPSHFDISSIEWREPDCYLIAGVIRETIQLVPARVGSGFRLRIPSRVLRSIPVDEPIRLELKDLKGLRWKVNPFLLYENVVYVSPVDTVEEIVHRYGEGEE